MLNIKICLSIKDADSIPRRRMGMVQPIVHSSNRFRATTHDVNFTSRTFVWIPTRTIFPKVSQPRRRWIFPEKISFEKSRASEGVPSSYIFWYILYIYIFIYTYSYFFCNIFPGLYIAPILSAFWSAFSSNHQSILISSWVPPSLGPAGDWTPTGSWALGPGPSFAPSPFPRRGRWVVRGGSLGAQWNCPELLVPLYTWIPIPNVKPPSNVKKNLNMKLSGVFELSPEYKPPFPKHNDNISIKINWYFGGTVTWAKFVVLIFILRIAWKYSP